MSIRKITDDLLFVGASDRRLALFESAYPVPEGVSYNAYLLRDEKNVLFDTVDRAVADTFLTATAEARAERRAKELAEKGQPADLARHRAARHKNRPLQVVQHLQKDVTDGVERRVQPQRQTDAHNLAQGSGIKAAGKNRQRKLCAVAAYCVAAVTCSKTASRTCNFSS